MNIPSQLTTKELDDIKQKRAVRRTLAKKSHQWFFTLYLSHYITYGFAPLHHDMFRITEDLREYLSVIVAFRGSGKSTLMTLSYPIWAITGVQQKKFVLILTQTQQQARQHMANIKQELENNDLLKDDIGPFEEGSDEWGANALILPYYKAKIIAASTEQSIRGLRHGAYRPDLIICDDVEDIASVKTKEGRDKTYTWLTGEVMPLGTKDTKIIVVGNLLHEDSLLMRLKQGFQKETLHGAFYSYPLVDQNETIAWPAVYPSLDAVEERKKRIGNEIAWQREYMLRIVADADTVVHPEWIHYYDSAITLPTIDLCEIATGVDLAISQSDSADYTAMVSAYGYRHDNITDYTYAGRFGEQTIYILPRPINKRLTFPETVGQIKELNHALRGNYPYTILVEDVSYQRSMVQMLEPAGMDVRGIRVTTDKRSRLSLTTSWIQSGKILFPREGAEDLIQQLTGFGIEKHDDLADAFSMLVIHLMERLSEPVPSIRVI